MTRSWGRRALFVEETAGCSAALAAGKRSISTSTSWITKQNIKHLEMLETFIGWA
jgi:hypothetical protein